MVKTILFILVRIAFIGAALGFVAPLVPGVSSSGTLLGALALGAGLIAVYSVARLIVARRYGLVKGSCPTPALQKKLTKIYLILTVLYVFAVVLVVPGLLAATNVFSAIAAGVIALVGAVASNIATRPFDKNATGGF